MARPCLCQVNEPPAARPILFEDTRADMMSNRTGKGKTSHCEDEVIMKKQALMTLATCLFFTASAWSDPGGGYGMGPGMMGGDGHGMMRGYGHGMMGGAGPGMMEGCGQGGWGPNIPDLTNDQRSKIAAIQKEFRQKQWALMEKMHENAESGNFYRGGKFDEQAARKAYDATTNLHKQMFENSLEAQKRMDAVLTTQQREQLQRRQSER